MAADEAKTVPVFRAVDQFSGSIAEAAQAIDKLTGQRDDARAEIDNIGELLVKACAVSTRLANELSHALSARNELEAERDDAERECEELREALEAARCRIQELEEEQ